MNYADSKTPYAATYADGAAPNIVVEILDSQPSSTGELHCRIVDEKSPKKGTTIIRKRRDMAALNPTAEAILAKTGERA